jgi:hypothetical protein
MIGLGGLLGGGLGLLFGIWHFQTAVADAEAHGLDADFLPVGIPVWSLVGGVMGTLTVGVISAIIFGLRHFSAKAASEPEIDVK